MGQALRSGETADKQLLFEDGVMDESPAAGDQIAFNMG